MCCRNLSRSLFRLLASFAAHAFPCSLLPFPRSASRRAAPLAAPLAAPHPFCSVSLPTLLQLSRARVEALFQAVVRAAGAGHVDHGGKEAIALSAPPTLTYFFLGPPSLDALSHTSALVP